LIATGDVCAATTPSTPRARRESVSGKWGFPGGALGPASGFNGILPTSAQRRTMANNARSCVFLAWLV
jgi:hypothetical protein